MTYVILLVGDHTLLYIQWQRVVCVGFGVWLLWRRGERLWLAGVGFVAGGDENCGWPGWAVVAAVIYGRGK